MNNKISRLFTEFFESEQASGVMLAFAIPFTDGGRSSPSYSLQHALNKPVAFVIMPAFALANTGVPLAGVYLAGFLGGIGFTMSIFITLLAFGESVFAQNSKIAILLGSLLAGCAGYFLLSRAAQGGADYGKEIE